MDVEAHGIMGLCSEAGELADLYKKQQVIDGDPDTATGEYLDPASVAEEVGDTLYYLVMLCNFHGLELADVMTMNIAKLRRRAALGKDPEAERRIFADGIAARRGR